MKEQSANKVGQQFRFRKGASIGEPDAESDEKYLASCFVDTGDYEVLTDCLCPQRIIVGRTGAGKSALIFHLMKNEENVIEISPENLSLNYLANSDIIKNLEKAGVKLDIFYTLLWRHVFSVELLKYRFGLTNEEKTKGWVSNFFSGLRKKDQSRERAIEYLKDWGDKFWCETEYRVKEITQKLENEIGAQLGTDFAALTASEKSSAEKKVEVLHKAQKVINEIQIKALSDVLHFLAEEVFNDPQQEYFIVIDKLDENWVEDELRYRLIRALIETVKAFRVIPSVKIIIALRVDLIQSVFERTRDAGFQEEKYQSLFLNISWDNNGLEELLDRRLSKLISQEYTTQNVTLRQVFPPAVGRSRFLDYLFTRTLYRPRDAIAFVNECLKRSADKGQITVHTVREAEVEYSAQRIESLNYEWTGHFPAFLQYLKLLERMPAQFKLSLIPKEKLDEFALTYAVDGEHSIDPVIRASYKYLNDGVSSHFVIIAWVKALFTIGILGIKPDGFTGQLWSYTEPRPPSDGQIKPTSIVYVHPMVWSRLGIKVDE
jgi:vacuolar-type H+-ATPase subunit H